jgi:DNA-binding transcriptional LysR family regulator
VQQKSFSGAAEILNLTPSAVSHAVADLEEKFGFPLFVRSRKGVTLTDSGEQVFSYINDILSTAELLEKRVSQINGNQSGTVRLGLIDSTASQWLPGIMKEYREQYPKIVVTARENTYSALVEAVVKRELDLAIVSHSSIRSLTTPLQFIPLYEDRLICASPKGFIPQNETFITPEELDGLNLIIPLGGNEFDVDLYLREHGVRGTRQNAAITNSSLISMVRSGFGHAVDASLSLYSAGSLEDLNLYPIVPFASRMLGIITHDPKKYLTPAVLAMINIITEYVKNYLNLK